MDSGGNSSATSALALGEASRKRIFDSTCINGFHLYRQILRVTSRCFGIISSVRNGFFRVTSHPSCVQRLQLSLTRWWWSREATPGGWSSDCSGGNVLAVPESGTGHCWCLFRGVQRTRGSDNPMGQDPGAGPMAVLEGKLRGVKSA